MIFLAYLWLISLSKEIRRVFQYHGAEHKSIFAFEAGDALRVDRVKSYSHLHPRCGTSFLLIVMVVSILVFALIPHHLPFGYKVASRVVFIPLIAGISYEFIRFADQKARDPRDAFLHPPWALVAAIDLQRAFRGPTRSGDSGSSGGFGTGGQDLKQCGILAGC